LVFLILFGSFFDSFRVNIEKGPVPVFRNQAPLCGKLQYASTNTNEPHFLSPSLPLPPDWS
jgi:hypothetical protein